MDSAFSMLRFYVPGLSRRKLPDASRIARVGTSRPFSPFRGEEDRVGAGNSCGGIVMVSNGRGYRRKLWRVGRW